MDMFGFIWAFFISTFPSPDLYLKSHFWLFLWRPSFLGSIPLPLLVWKGTIICFLVIKMITTYLEAYFCVHISNEPKLDKNQSPLLSPPSVLSFPATIPLSPVSAATVFHDHLELSLNRHKSQDF